MYISKRTGMDHTVLSANTPCLPFLRKRSPDGATPNWGRRHPIAAYCHWIYRPRRDDRLSWRGWLTCSGQFTHVSGHPSATGQAQDRESLPAKDRRSDAVSRNQLITYWTSPFYPPPLYRLQSCNAPGFICWLRLYVNRLLIYFLTYFLTYLPTSLFIYLRIRPFSFQVIRIDQTWLQFFAVYFVL